ncbi:MAG: Dyp-type peroxidase [bacterium]|nr:Dyp-type peroxidase [bacterium]
MPVQSGILPQPSVHARFLVLRCRAADEAPARARLKKCLQHFDATRRRLQMQYADASLFSVAGFGPALWQQLAGTMPGGLRELQPLAGTFAMPASGGDLLLHIHGDRYDLCFALAQSFMAESGDLFEVLEEVAGFRYLDSRDLTGFIDGTENPQESQGRAEAALLGEEAGVYAHGSFVFAQRYVHQLDKWQRLSVDTQEQVIGRTKLESIELDDAVKPANAHIARTVIEEDGEELEIVRHSMPYGESAGEQGLFFIAYTKELSIIDRMLARMFGTSGDGSSDRLLNFVTPVGGAYFFAPPVALWNAIVAED